MERNGRQKYFCSVCKAYLANNFTTRRHVLSRHINNQMKCPICNEEFTTLPKKRHHLLMKHNLEEFGEGKHKELRERSKVVCDECKKEYTNKRGLQIHMTNVHTLYKCPDCPSMFPEKALLIHRNDVHGTPIPTCGICGYRNSDAARVFLHQRSVHLKERTVPCELCDRTFFCVKQLRRHLVRHRPERIHECKYCHKKYPRKNTLRMHEKIHKGEKNKVCAVCGERFVQKASLNYHMIRHHPDAC